MWAAIATYGTTGDVQPLLGLACEMSRQGHRITFAAPPTFRARVVELGLEFIPLGPSIEIDELRDVYGRAFLHADCVSQVELTLPLVVKHTPRMVKELTAACEGADVLLSLPYQLAGRIVHELTAIPLVSVHLSPFAGYNKRFAETSAGLINEVRLCYGLEELRDPLGIDGSSSLLALHAVSPDIIKRPRHWPAHFQITGFWFLDEDFTPEPELRAFIESGEPPVVVALGSMVHASPNQLATTISEAIQRTGRRVVVQRGWTGLSLLGCSEKVHSVDFVPHRWLFERAGAVIHAGGAGTTAAALRAGAPSIVIPHWLDQYLWGHLIRERGCAADVIPFVDLTPEILAAAIERSSDQAIRKSTIAIAHAIENEAGVPTAISLIEHVLRR